MCYILQILLWYFNKRVSTGWWFQAIRKAFEWHWAISTSFLVFNKHLRQVFPSSVTPCALCVFAHASTCAAAKPGERISDAEVESLWHSRVKAIVGEKSTSRRPFRHVWRTVQSCSFGRSSWQPGDVKAAQGNGCSGGCVDRALPSLAMVTVTGGEYIVICAQSQLCSHSEVFHVSVFNVHRTQCVGAV